MSLGINRDGLWFADELGDIVPSMTGLLFTSTICAQFQSKMREAVNPSKEKRFFS